jgi:hypothetical protein
MAPTKILSICSLAIVFLTVTIIPINSRAIDGTTLDSSGAPKGGTSHSEMMPSYWSDPEELKRTRDGAKGAFRSTPGSLSINEEFIREARKLPWIAVTSAEEMEQSQILSDRWVRKIIGQNDKLFGYMVHRARDQASVRIIDENTVKLFYHFVQTSPR